MKPASTTAKPVVVGGGLAFAWLLVAALATGCGGINASKTISPLDFFLPGLIQNRPPLPAIPIQTNNVSLLAQAGAFPQ